MSSDVELVFRECGSQQPALESRAQSRDYGIFKAAGPVSRILSAEHSPSQTEICNSNHVPQDGHSSGPRITTRL
jgi:hypothetical protein